MTDVPKNQAIEPTLTAYHAPFHWRLLHPRYVSTWLGLGALWLLHRLPRRVVRACVPSLAWGLERWGKKRRRRAVVNLAWCFPDLTETEREDLLREHYRITAQVLLDYGLLWFGLSPKHLQRIELQGLEHYQGWQAQGRAVIFLSPHALALDHGGQRGSVCIPGVSFAKPMRNAVIEWLNTRARTRHGGIMLTRDQGLRPALRAIRAGRAFYFLPDEDIGAQSVVFADFFGVPKATLTSTARLARMAKAVVLPTFTYYDPETDRYCVRIWPALENFPSGDEVQDARCINAAIEEAIRLAPAQYYWSMRLFRTRPAGERDGPTYAVSAESGK